MGYIGTPPANRVLSSADIAQGAVTLNDINFTDQPVNMDITGTIDKHTMRLADGVTITGDVTISDDLVLSKISDDGNAITMTNDGSSRTITGSGSIEASTLSQTPNASLTGMTGTIGSAVTNNAGVASGTIGSVVTGSPNLNLGNATFPAGNVLQVVTTSGICAVTSTTSSAFSDVTGVNLSITPSATSSKILIMYSLYSIITTSTHGGAFQLVRNSTALNTPTATNQSYIDGANQSYTNTASQYEDSPATTSATTYKIQIRSNVTGRTFSTNANQYQSITAFEIAG